MQIDISVGIFWDISSNCHLKHADLSNGGPFLKSLVPFLEEPMLFLLASKWNLWEKAFFCVKIKTNSNFAVKLTEISKFQYLSQKRIQVVDQRDWSPPKIQHLKFWWQPSFYYYFTFVMVNLYSVISLFCFFNYCLEIVILIVCLAPKGFASLFAFIHLC